MYCSDVSYKNFIYIKANIDLEKRRDNRVGHFVFVKNFS